MDAVRAVWARRLRVPAEVLERDEPVFVDRPDLTAVVVVRLGGMTAVVASEPALSALRRLAGDQLVEVGALLVALESAGPSLIGAASLSYADHGTIAPVLDGVVRAATAADVEAVLSRCSAAERGECGLADMGMRWVAPGPSGELEAASGYEVWADRLAHLGLAVAPGCRSQGLGSRAATVASVQAIDAGLVPQWRCRLDNHASARAGERLGFVRVGEQVAIDVAALTTL